MKALIAVFALAISIQSWASPAGVYYSALTDNKDGSYNPEQLFEMSETTLRVTTIHNGAKVVEVYPITVSGNVINMSVTKGLTSRYDCNGEEISNEMADATNKVTYQKTKDGITVVVDGEKITYVNAKKDQIDRVQSLPLCSLK